eukprot:PITA_06599
MNSLLENKTWELVNLPKGRKALQNKWVYKIKHEDDEKKERYKTRLVVKSFAQKEGIDFTEIFSLVVKMSSIRVILGLVAALDLECEQLDVKTAFLHGELEETIYMELPKGFVEKGKEGLVYADMAGDMDTRKSTTGYLYTFACAVVSWVSRLQRIVALSTTEA